MLLWIRCSARAIVACVAVSRRTRSRLTCAADKMSPNLTSADASTLTTAILSCWTRATRFCRPPTGDIVLNRDISQLTDTNTAASLNAVLTKVPEGQGVGAELPKGQKLPAGHIPPPSLGISGAALTVPPLQKWPGAQPPRVLESPRPSQNLPGSQAVHSVAFRRPRLLPYVPTGHGVGNVDPSPQ